MEKIDNPVIITILKYLVQDNTQLFKDPPSCLMIYRILPEISKNLILRVINTTNNGIIEINELKSHDIFVNTNQNVSPYLTGLMIVKILQKYQDDTNSKIKFNEDFIKTMKDILSKGIINDSIQTHRKPKGYENSLERGINRFYRFINEKIFDQVGKSHTANHINNFLTKKNFLHIESDRYQFGSSSYNLFLCTTEDKIKNLFQLYLGFCYEKNNDKDKKLKFVKLLFYLATLEPGTSFVEFPKDYYDPSFDEHLKFMNQTGFLIIREENDKKSSKKYFCTPLIQGLFENNDLSKNYSLIKYGDENAERFLFVETNMKFYAYMPYVKKSNKNKENPNNSLSLMDFSSSTTLREEKEDKKQDARTLFNINLLKTLFKIELILPNMLIGNITRERLRKLFKNAKSEHILQFLSDHMSLKSDDVTEVKGKKYLINESVVNQILILEREKNAIQICKPVICLYDFYEKQYESYLKKMEKNHIDYIYANDKKQIIVVYKTKENLNRINEIDKQIQNNNYN